ncbi:MAG: leucine-rich repeat domain-containing protein [Candidatus Coproplasma sp.]
MKKRLIAFFALIAVVFTCGFGLIGCSNGSTGLEYTLLEDESSYICSGIGTCNKADITIASRHKGKKVTEIKPHAFRDCTSIESVTIPGSVTTIGVDAFETCYSLRSVNLKDGVTTIDGGAFSSCPSLTSINIPDSVTHIGNTAFHGSVGVKHKENGLIYVDRWVIECESSIDNLVLRDDTRGIAELTFSSFTKLSSVTLPESLLYIGESAFWGCNKLTNVTIPDSVVLIGLSAFSSCISLNGLTIGKSVVTIDDYAFIYCESLESVTIPDSVNYIGKDAFAACTSLASVSMGKGVTDIGDFAFEACESLTGISYNGTKAQWNAINKGSYWNVNTNDFTISCTDGTLDKDGNEIL